MALFDINELLSAPCIFCGYNSYGFYQAHTHDNNCPFYKIGGQNEREHALAVWGKKGMLSIKGYGQQPHNPSLKADKLPS